MKATIVMNTGVEVYVEGELVEWLHEYFTENKGPREVRELSWVGTEDRLINLAHAISIDFTKEDGA